MTGATRKPRRCRLWPGRYSLDTRRSLMLMEAARLVNAGYNRTGCDALSAILPQDDAGTAVWHECREYLLLMVPERFERPWGWWASRKARVIGLLLASAIARDAEVHAGSGGS